ncbi:hypothetical protein SKAU_G00189170 [Synaphobranchus kaupii]|uniref:Uncharacterized protein n=1 Tax=Synaphobranchus kaupii TaxID=118154 RepID=A0A9Q1IX27_SYNKA|nr:hypothetical protein SKAU_G00189170 [Synaphobranchus kaupii]
MARGRLTNSLATERSQAVSAGTHSACTWLIYMCEGHRSAVTEGLCWAAFVRVSAGTIRSGNSNSSLLEPSRAEQRKWVRVRQLELQLHSTPPHSHTQQPSRLPASPLQHGGTPQEQTVCENALLNRTCAFPSTAS